MPNYAVHYEAEFDGVDHRAEQSSVVSAIDIEAASQVFTDRVDDSLLSGDPINIIVTDIAELWENE